MKNTARYKSFGRFAPSFNASAKLKLLKCLAKIPLNGYIIIRFIIAKSHNSANALFQKLTDSSMI